ncbi:DNA-binding protein YbaB [Allocatelliglobosispora scoriae]|uniref:DNA-binding protein YbaB n=1 Tax=Allocatelliglobosispora scoriae TaxID=643052 RepID=A0A841C5H5_9ACTN|nr:YbaB/EbfC family nucleoid-associated protein [Allocatelliglobosispora scoriae]MBB5874200.1 DNA-binding protein YbaB [Allocatelliglobosispora scoriae]
MSSGFESLINEMMTELERQRAEMTRLQEGLASITATAVSPKRQVSVTVDAKGEVTELKFLTQAYRTMAGAELSDLIVTTLRDAQRDVKGKLAAHAGTAGPPGATPADIANGTVDWSVALTDIFTMPASLVDLLGHRPTDLLDGVDIDRPDVVLDELREARDSGRKPQERGPAQ